MLMLTLFNSIKQYDKHLFAMIYLILNNSRSSLSKILYIQSLIVELKDIFQANWSIYNIQRQCVSAKDQLTYTSCSMYWYNK